MKKLSLIFATSILAVAILFGSLMGQTSTAHAASTPNSTQKAPTTSEVQALISNIHMYVHVVNHHATIDAQLKVAVSQEQFQVIRQAVTIYNTTPASASNAVPVAARQIQASHSVSNSVPKTNWWYCYYISNGTMDNIAWAIIFGGVVAAIVGILAAETGVGVAIAIAGVLLGFGGAYLLWYSDKYWPNGTTWCSNGSSLYYYVD